jgi:thioredoxin 1
MEQKTNRHSHLPSPMATKISGAESLTNFLTVSPTLLVKWSAPWCGPCTLIHPAFEEVAKAAKEGVTCVYIPNADHGDYDSYHIFSLPTFQLYVNGKLTKEISGVNQQTIPTLKQWIA